MRVSSMMFMLTLLAMLQQARLYSFDPGSISFQGDQRSDWAKQIAIPLSKKYKKPAEDILIRLLAATMAEKVYPNESGTLALSAKMAERPFLIIAELQKLDAALNASQLPTQWQQDYLKEIGAQFLFPIRQGPPRLAVKHHGSLINGLPKDSRLVTVTAEQSLVDVIATVWPDISSASAWDLYFIYEALCRCNPGLTWAGQYIDKQSRDRVTRISLGTDLDEIQMYQWLYAIDPGLRFRPAAGTQATQGDQLSMPLGDGYHRHVRYRLHAGTALLIPPQAWFAALQSAPQRSCRNSGLRDPSLVLHDQLVSLDLSGCAVAGLDALRSCTKLQNLRLDHCPVNELSALNKLPLQRLSLRGCPVTDLEPLAALQLQALDLSYSAVSSLAPLATRPLQELNIMACPVSDLSPLNGKKLTLLQLDTWTVYKAPEAIAACQTIGDIPYADWLAEQEQLATPPEDAQTSKEQKGKLVKEKAKKKTTPKAKPQIKKGPSSDSIPNNPRARKKKGASAKLDAELDELLD